MTLKFDESTVLFIHWVKECMFQDGFDPQTALCRHYSVPLWNAHRSFNTLLMLGSQGIFLTFGFIRMNVVLDG